MYIQTYSPIVGIVLIIVGAGLLFFAAGELILRIILALCALAIINHGMQLCGRSPQTYMRSSWSGWYRSF